MTRQIVILLILSCLAENFRQLDATSTILKRYLFIHHEPPVKFNQKMANTVTEHYITQRLDNFNHQDQRTFQMRYLKNSVHYKSGGPVFIVIGGEWEIGTGHIIMGQHIYDMAKKFNGLLIYTEHRFYGKTQPTNTTSTDNLKYLSVDQSLADLAHFVREITADKELNATGGVIVVGGSYAATMAAWFRQKYPHLVKGAWASSAPLHAKLNYFEYTETVGKSIRKIGGDDCYNSIKNAFSAIEDLLENHDEGYLKSLFNLCDKFDTNNTFDVWNFVSAAKELFADIVQGYSSGVMEKHCKNLTREDVNKPVENQSLLNFAKMFQTKLRSPNATCISVNYENEINQLKKDDINAPSAARAWYYQTCSEFGWYQTTDSKKHPFGTKSPIEYHLKICQDVFGDVFNDSTYQKSLDHTNDLYGGFDPAVTNVYFTHGSLDPWHRMGVLKDLNKHSPSIVIPGISHCRDLGSINYRTDSKELINSKVNIMTLVKKWLKY